MKCGIDHFTLALAGCDHRIIVGVSAPLAAEKLIVVKRLAVGNEKDRTLLCDALGAGRSPG